MSKFGVIGICAIVGVQLAEYKDKSKKRSKGDIILEANLHASERMGARNRLRFVRPCLR
jgi:hypothetical protein